MIRLISSLKQFTAPDFSHPVQSGSSYVTYTITHNLGSKNLLEAIKFTTASTPTTVDCYGAFYASGSYYGHVLRMTSDNVCSLELYRNPKYTSAASIMKVSFYRMD